VKSFARTVGRSDRTPSRMMDMRLGILLKVRKDSE
jgi:hypothetical protein